MQSLIADLDIELPADPESVGHARHAAGQLAEACGADETDVKIGVSEAVGNAVIHAYRDGGGGPIRVSGALHDDKLVIVVADEGVGMSPDPGSPGLGLGLPLIGNVTEDMHVTASPGGTTISMSFPASDGPAS